MNTKCAIGQHDYRKEYPDQELIDAVRWKQDIEEIWVCRRPGCNKTKKVAGTIGEIVSH